MVDVTAGSISACFGPIPADAGIGLKAQHYQEILESGPALGWFEVHPENYMGAGGAPHHYLTRIRERYPLSLHGVGMSLGSAVPPDRDHLARLKTLVDRYEPGLVSEHLAWSAFDGVFLNDLLPLPLTYETLSHVVTHVDEVQETLGRRVLIENPSTYVRARGDEMIEPDFLTELARRTGCGLLLDINNVYVSACNHDFDAKTYLERIEPELVGEIHLAGHAVERVAGGELRIDDHGSQVCEAVWALYGGFIARAGVKPTLIEWDTDVPSLGTLQDEARRAQAILDAQMSLLQKECVAQKGCVGDAAVA